MGKRAAAIVGFTEWAPQRKWDRPMFGLEAAAQLAAEALADVGLEKDAVDGLVIGGLQESPLFAPLALAEYLGIQSHFNEVVDIGGATSAGMVWRAAAAIEVGICETVLVLVPSVPAPVESGGSPDKMMLPFYLMGDAWGSPQSQYDIPYGLVAATPSFAMVASRYMAEYGVAPETLAKLAVDERYNAQKNPKAVFRDRMITVEDVLASPMIADPIHLLEMVMPCFGGGAVVLTSAERAKKLPHRPVFVSGYGEFVSHKTVTYMPDFLETPARAAADQAFAMAGCRAQRHRRRLLLRLLHDHPAADHRGRRVREEGRGWTLRRGARPAIRLCGRRRRGREALQLRRQRAQRGQARRLDGCGGLAGRVRRGGTVHRRHHRGRQ